MITISPIYAGLVAILFLVLSYRVTLGRRAHQVSIGDGGHKALVKRIRVQANCAEYAPIGIILLAMAELQGAAGWLLHLGGLMLLSGRALHAYGLGSTPQVVPARINGMYLTFAMIALMALTNIAYAVI